MFGKSQKPATVTANLSNSDVKAVAHTFDQTNGVMKAFDDYQARQFEQRAATSGTATPRERRHHRHAPATT